MGARKAEIGQHPIAHELGDEAVVARERARTGVLIGTDELAHVLRIKPRRHRRRAHEHDRELAALGGVRSLRTSESMSFSRNNVSCCSRPRPRSQTATSIVVSLDRPNSMMVLRRCGVHRFRERLRWFEMLVRQRRPGVTALCAKPPSVMARQTSLHHRSNQTRNRHGWRCLAERKLRLRVRQYGERYLWYESISLRHELSV